MAMYHQDQQHRDVIASCWFTEGRGTMGVVAVFTGQRHGDVKEWQAYIGIAYCPHLQIGQDTSDMDVTRGLWLDVQHIREWGQKLSPELAVAIFDQLKIEDNRMWLEAHPDERAKRIVDAN